MLLLLARVQEARRAWQGAVPVVSQTWVEACIKQKAQVRQQPHTHHSTSVIEQQLGHHHPAGPLQHHLHTLLAGHPTHVQLSWPGTVCWHLYLPPCPLDRQQYSNMHTWTQHVHLRRWMWAPTSWVPWRGLRSAQPTLWPRSACCCTGVSAEGWGAGLVLQLHGCWPLWTFA